MQIQTNFLFDQNTELDKQDDFTASSSYSSNFEDASPVELQDSSTSNPGSSEFVSKLVHNTAPAKSLLSTTNINLLNKSNTEPPSTYRDKLKDILHAKEAISIEGKMVPFPPRDSWKSGTSKWKLLFGGDRLDFSSHPLLFLSNKFHALGPVYQTNLLSRDMVVMYGAEACSLFFDPHKMERKLRFNELYHLLLRDARQEYQLHEHILQHARHSVCATMLDNDMWNSFIPTWDNIFDVHLEKWIKKRTFKWSDAMRLLLMDSMSKYLLGVERSEELAHFLFDHFGALEKHIANPTTATKHATILKDKLFSIVQRHYYGLWTESVDVPHVMQRIAKQIKEVNGEVKYVVRDELFQILFTLFEVTTHVLCQAMLYIHNYPFLWQQVVLQLQQQPLLQVDDIKLQNMVDYIMQSCIYVPLLFGKSKCNLTIDGKAILKDTLCAFCPLDLKSNNLNTNVDATRYPSISFPREKVPIYELSRKVLHFVLTKLAKQRQLSWKLLEKQKLDTNYNTPFFQIPDGILLFDFSQ